MIDLHLHSYFSMDSEESLEKIVDRAISLNIETIALTDHIDMYVDNPASSFDFDLDKYFDTLNKLKEDYKDKLEILIGVEIGIQPDTCAYNEKILNSYPFDFSIGSIHAVKGMDIYMDKYLTKFPPEEALKYYYDDMLYSVKNTRGFNVLGHVDYIDRYFEDKSTIPDYEIYYPIIEEILKELIATDRGIEINTAGLRKGLSYMNPKDEIIELYKKLGGNIITIGSDSHFYTTIGAYYQEAVEKLKKSGFTHINKFIKNKPIKIEI